MISQENGIDIVVFDIWKGSEFGNAKESKSRVGSGVVSHILSQPGHWFCGERIDAAVCGEGD